MDSLIIARILHNILGVSVYSFPKGNSNASFFRSINPHHFSVQLEPSFLNAFLASMKESTYYEFIDNLGQRSFIFQYEGNYFFIGPYFSRASEVDFSKAFSENGLPYSSLPSYRDYIYSRPILNPYFIETTCNNVLRGVHSSSFFNFAYEKIDFRAQRKEPSLSLGLPIDSAKKEAQVNKRYDVERLFLEKIEKGDLEGIRNSASALFTSTDQSNDAATYFFANPEVSSAMFRTMVRMAAIRSGLPPVIIDRITSKYAQKMRQATTQQEYMNHFVSLVEDITTAIHDYKMTALKCGALSKQTIAYIYLHLETHWSLDDLAKKMNVSKSYLEHVFKEETGKTIHRFGEETRVKEAKKLLLETDLPIGEVAHFVGYDDPNYFVKIFKRYEKETPSSFRNHNNAREVL